MEKDKGPSVFNNSLQIITVSKSVGSKSHILSRGQKFHSNEIYIFLDVSF